MDNENLFRNIFSQTNATQLLQRSCFWCHWSQKIPMVLQETKTDHVQKWQTGWLSREREYMRSVAQHFLSLPGNSSGSGHLTQSNRRIRWTSHSVSINALAYNLCSVMQNTLTLTNDSLHRHAGNHIPKPSTCKILRRL